jgi:putative SOS response-associated peptidase YedK
MCGRYYRKSDKQKIADAFHVKHVEDFPLPPWDYNVAPTTMQPVIRNNRDTGEREQVSLRWGLLPFWAKDLQSFKGNSTINARAENITASRTYANRSNVDAVVLYRPQAFTSGSALAARWLRRT